MNLALIIVALTVFGLYAPQDDDSSLDSCVDSFRTDVLAFISDDLNVSRKAEERLVNDQFDFLPMELIQAHDPDLTWMDTSVTSKLASRLDSFTESPQTIICALELLARSPEIDESVRNSIIKIVNDPGSSSSSRITAFQTLCYQTPINDSVFDDIEQLVLTFDLYLYSLLIDEWSDEVDIMFRYQGLGMVVDWMGTTVIAANRLENEIQGIVKHLRTSETKAEKIFCLYWLFLTFDKQTETYLPDMKKLQQDKDSDVRFFATLHVAGLSDDPVERARLIKDADLSDQLKQELETILAEYKTEKNGD